MSNETQPQPVDPNRAEEYLACLLCLSSAISLFLNGQAPKEILAEAMKTTERSRK